jgi:hypothetical protein
MGTGLHCSPCALSYTTTQHSELSHCVGSETPGEAGGLDGDRGGRGAAGSDDAVLTLSARLHKQIFVCEHVRKLSCKNFPLVQAVRIG